MTNKKKIPLVFVVLVLVILNLPQFSRADVVTNEYPFVYLFHLYYDNGQLFADRDFEFKYDLIAEPFMPEIPASDDALRGKVINVLNNVAAVFDFDPKRGNPAFTKGKISVKAPFFADAARVDFYDPQDKKLLSLDVGSSSFCNDDGVCSPDTGEDPNNCPLDCQAVSGSKNYSLWFFAAIFVIVIFVVWLIMRRKEEEEKEDIQLPDNNAGENKNLP